MYAFFLCTQALNRTKSVQEYDSLAGSSPLTERNVADSSGTTIFESTPLTKGKKSRSKWARKLMALKNSPFNENTDPLMERWLQSEIEKNREKTDLILLLKAKTKVEIEIMAIQKIKLDLEIHKMKLELGDHAYHYK